MITELSKLTMSQYIDIVCGDIKILGIKNPKEASDARKKLIFEFSSIADPTTTAAYINRRKSESDSKTTLLLFDICHNLIIMREMDEVRNILNEYGVRTESMTDDQVKQEVEGRRRRAKSMAERKSVEEDTDEQQRSEEDIRRMYDRQCASLMTYFKFQIDMNTIKATQFACMIDQAAREIKAKQAALSKKR